MSNIPEVYLLQATRKHLEKAKSFQDDMGGHFFEHTMYDVQDALTSILALCDMEDMKQVPQVKKYIQRVTGLLNDVKFYSSSSLFNINHVVINIINILKDHYKSSLTISHELNVINAHAQSNKSHLERMLLYLLIEAIETADESHLKFEIELSQKDRDAVIFLKLVNFTYTPVVLRELNQFHKEEAFILQMNQVGQDTEIIIKAPLSFDSKEVKKEDSNEMLSSVKVDHLQISEHKSAQVSEKSQKEVQRHSSLTM